MSRRQRWAVVWKEFLYWNPEMSADEKHAHRNGCYGKLSLDYLTALRMAKRLDELPDKKYPFVNTYKCRVCHKHHVGHRKQPVHNMDN